MLPRWYANIDRAGPQVLGGIPLSIRVREVAVLLVVVCSQHLERRHFPEHGKESVLERHLVAHRSGASSMNLASQPSA